MFIISIIIFSIAVLVVSVMYPFVLALARKHKVLDNPNERKLHRNPVPLLGGVSVWIGIAIACAGALIPFFLHNVFGRNTKMFIGDCGSLMMGMAMTYFVFYAIAHNGNCSKLSAEGVDLISYTLAVLSVPVIDTLRVMTVRIARRRSPFSPDKTHLNHLFIDAGFSHVGASMACILLGLTIFGVWLVSYLAGASANLQFVLTVLSGGLCVVVFYPWMRAAQRKNSARWRALCRIGTLTHREGSRWWAFAARRMDR